MLPNHMMTMLTKCNICDEMMQQYQNRKHVFLYNILCSILIGKCFRETRAAGIETIKNNRFEKKKKIS